MQKRFGNIRILPLHSKADKPATRILIGGTKGSRAAMQMLPPLIIHQADGTFTPQTEDVLRGRTEVDLFA
jgi:tRNA1(Val) A37 N6-methylase TrmN6